MGAGEAMAFTLVIRDFEMSKTLYRLRLGILGLESHLKIVLGHIVA